MQANSKFIQTVTYIVMPMLTATNKRMTNAIPIAKKKCDIIILWSFNLWRKYVKLSKQILTLLALFAELFSFKSFHQICLTKWKNHQLWTFHRISFFMRWPIEIVINDPLIQANIMQSYYLLPCKHPSSSQLPSCPSRRLLRSNQTFSRQHQSQCI